MQTTGTPAPKRDYIAELKVCTTLEDLCRLRDDLTDFVSEKRDGRETAAFYRRQASDQITYLLEKGVFLAPVSAADFKQRLNEIEARTNNLASGIAEANSVMFKALKHIVESEDIEAAISIAKNTLRMFALSPTDHTNQ